MEASRPAGPRPRGEGPGPIAPDGSAVDLYLAFPYRGELDTLAGHLPPACSVLELGCGPGRLTRLLLQAGHPVTAVDNSAEMLRHVPVEACTILCDIESLDLARTFDVVLLASNLINATNDALRHELLAASRRHLAPGGCLLFERLDPEWLCRPGTEPFPAAGEVGIVVERAPRDGDRVEVSVHYTSGARQWKHHFTARVLEDGDVRGALAEAGFTAVEWITRRWGRAVA